MSGRFTGRSVQYLHFQLLFFSVENFPGEGYCLAEKNPDTPDKRRFHRLGKARH